VTTNRIDEILSLVREQIEVRRSTGQFPLGYEALVEDFHIAQLGKVRAAELSDVSKLVEQIQDLCAEMAKLVETPPDESRFRLVRVIRDSARTRHDLRQTKQHVMVVNQKLGDLLGELVAGLALKTEASDRIAVSLFEQVLERTLVIDQLVVVCRDMEERLRAIEESK
jgi:hypothetical protein